MKKVIFSVIIAVVSIVPLSVQALAEQAPLLEQQSPIVQIQPAPAQEYLQTFIVTNHQGEHEVTHCRAILGKEGLQIVFPPNPAYHLVVSIDAANPADLVAKVQWQPLDNMKVSMYVESQKVTLNKEHYVVGDLLKGAIDVTFRIQWVATGKEATYYFKGTFSALVRPEEFDPFSDETIKTYTPAIAAYEFGLASELGSYLEGDVLLDVGNDKGFIEKDIYGTFATYSPKYYETLEVVRTIFFAEHAQLTGSIVREMRWSIDPLVEDNKHLSMWFKQVGKEWVPLGFIWWGVEGV